MSRIEDAIEHEDSNDYSSPPFMPEGEEEDEDANGMLHILPIDSGKSHSTDDSIHDPESEAAKLAIEAEDDFTEVDDEENRLAETTTAGATSFETDPDAAATTVCTTAHGDKPIVQFALTIDAGSTGSRIHVYKFHNCGPSPQLEYETFLSVNPGLSAFARDPTAAAASLDPLLQEAIRVVPKSLQKCSPVEVKATAGLRLLGAKESEAILEEVKNRLETDWPFTVHGDKAVEIMDGKDEGECVVFIATWLADEYRCVCMDYRKLPAQQDRRVGNHPRHPRCHGSWRRFHPDRLRARLSRRFRADPH
jgi:guanosine-diphosphatase